METEPASKVSHISLSRQCLIEILPLWQIWSERHINLVSIMKF